MLVKSRVLDRLGKEARHLTEKMKEFDTNRDGTVDQKEFQQGI